MPLLADHQPETAADARWLREHAGITDVAFSMSLHPEQRPLEAKVEALAARFRGMQGALRGSGLRVGILIQSSLSHGDKGGTLTDAGFQTIVASDGAVTVRMCPLDPGFVRYLCDAVATLCKCAPDFLIVDDDFRLSLNAFGCFCPLHLERLRARTGVVHTRETLMDLLQREDAGSREVGEHWNAVLQESLVDLAQAMRAEIDAIDPAIPCDYSTYVGEFRFARAIAQALAGRTAPCVHVNDAWYLENSWYSSLGYKFVPKRLTHTAMQVAALAGIPEILTEADTYFHNPHALSARSLHAQLVATLLNGVTGAKLWITVMNECEPAGGRGYRASLAAHRGLYDRLQRLLRGVRWLGPATPLPASPRSNWNPVVWEKQGRQVNWAGDILGRLGIPAGIGGEDAAVVMLWGREVDGFSDDEVRSFLRRGVLLDGEAAELLCRRGWGGLLGVDVDHPSWRVSGERYTEHPLNGGLAGRHARPVHYRLQSRRLAPRGDRVAVLSWLFRTPWITSPDEERMGPGLTLFENELGGRVAVYAATEPELFLMNESRKVQLVAVLGALAREPLRVVAHGADVYVRHGAVAAAQGGGELVAVFNLNPDPLPALTLQVAGPPVAAIARLGGDGQWADVPWRREGAGLLVVDVAVETMVPLVLRLQGEGSVEP